MRRRLALALLAMSALLAGGCIVRDGDSSTGSSRLRSPSMTDDAMIDRRASETPAYHRYDAP